MSTSLSKRLCLGQVFSRVFLTPVVVFCHVRAGDAFFVFDRWVCQASSSDKTGFWSIPPLLFGNMTYAWTFSNGFHVYFTPHGSDDRRNQGTFD